jgi:c-di-GMP-related signal transduction protein
MHQTNFIVREPLLDPAQRVIGYELCWQQRRPGPRRRRPRTLVGFVAEHVVDEEHGWLLRDKQLFLDAVPAMLSPTRCTRCRPSAPC